MTYLTKNTTFFSNLDGMQAICAEKMSVKKVVPKHPFSLTAFGSSPKGAPLSDYRKVTRHN